MQDDDHPLVREFPHPAGGRHAVASALEAFWRQAIPLKAVESFRSANKAGGFDCPGCAFPDRHDGRAVDSCEQGQKAIAWEMTRRAADGEFFARHTLAELRTWPDRELENAGRLTEPLCYDVASDRYRPIDWAEACRRAAGLLGRLDPSTVAFYTSGRSSNEAAFLWQFLARAYGSANLPDSSNLCHEPSGYAMKDMLGVGKGTCSLEDFERAELIIVIGQNPASNHPRMMTALNAAAARGAAVIALNPLDELGFRNFADPKELGGMLTGRGRRVARKVYRVRIGGDLAALKGVMKILLERGDAAVDREFIASHTQGFDAFAADIAGEPWEGILAESGLARRELEEIADLYQGSAATMCTWCMGITHHEQAVATVQSIVNFLLLKGNLGKPGAGAVPVRGHSNVQGNRTVGATGRVPPRFLDQLEAVFRVSVRREPGLDAVGVAHGLLAGHIRAFLALGGNYGVAIPDGPRVRAALESCELTAHVATKLNRTHLHPGRLGLLLPALGRTDRDGEQRVSVEDSMSMTHASRGIQPPLSAAMKGEPVVVCALGEALLPDAAPWGALAADYRLIRQRIEACLAGVFEGFAGYEEKLARPGGFWLPNPASQRTWNTVSGKAEFRVHPIAEGPVHRARRRCGDAVLALMTVRSHDQFNTTVYGQDDRYRGVFGGRRVIFMNPDDLGRRGLRAGERVDIESVAEDGVSRRVTDFLAVAHDIPQGCAAAYFPEATPLMDLSLVSLHTATPAYKEIPVLVRRSAGGAGG